jgi:DNA-binding transcriptional LysR family regulator
MSSSSQWLLPARLRMRQLLLLATLGDEGNIHRAAEALHMSQPAASKLLKDLEDALDVPLFDRLPRGMSPTWYGEAMIRHARMALASLGEAREEVEALKAGRFGNASVGSITTAGISLLPGAIAMVKREYPSLHISMQIETSDVLLERLAQGKLDMIVARLFERHDKTNLRYEKLAEEPVSAIARRGHPLARAKKLKLAELVDAGWVVPPTGSVLRHRWELMFQEAGLDIPSNIVETTAILFITKLLQQTDFIAVVDRDLGAYYAEHGFVDVLPIQLSCSMDAFGIIRRTDRLLSPAARVLLQALRTSAAKVYGVKFEGAE